jgi:hypothetical protein
VHLVSSLGAPDDVVDGADVASNDERHAALA